MRSVVGTIAGMMTLLFVGVGLTLVTDLSITGAALPGAPGTLFGILPTLFLFVFFPLSFIGLVAFAWTRLKS